MLDIISYLADVFLPLQPLTEHLNISAMDYPKGGLEISCSAKRWAEDDWKWCSYPSTYSNCTGSWLYAPVHALVQADFIIRWSTDPGLPLVEPPLGFLAQLVCKGTLLPQLKYFTGCSLHLFTFILYREYKITQGLPDSNFELGMGANICKSILISCHTFSIGLKSELLIGQYLINAT